MKQKLHFFSLLLLTVALLMPAKTMAQVTQGYYTYTLSGTEATVTKCTQTSGAVVIPETIVHGGKTYKVTAVKFNSMLFYFAPTSITGNSITSITGAAREVSNSSTFSNDNYLYEDGICSSISFPKLKTIKNCKIGQGTFTSISFPELENIEAVKGLFAGCLNLSFISLPKLKTISGYKIFNNLPALISLNLPELTEIKDAADCLYNLPALTSLSLPKLNYIMGYQILSGLAALPSLSLPELPKIEAGAQYILNGYASLTTLDLPKLTSVSGEGVISSLPALQILNVPELAIIKYPGIYTFGDLGLHTLNAPKLKKIQWGGMIFRDSKLSVLNFAYGCEIEASGMLRMPDPSVSSITITGVTKIKDSGFISYGQNTLKHIELPDVIEFEGGTGRNSAAIESFSAPNLKKLKAQLFTNGSYSNLTTVDIHNLQEITSSRLFNDAPITNLTLRGDLQVDASSTINLQTYPTVITITDEATANDIPASFFAGVKGGRFIAPKGKAGMYVTKWNLNTAKTMVYSPVEINKSTASTLYASGSITKADASFTYGGTTYKNQYDMSHAMTAAECLDAFVLSVNDYGFTPTLATQTVQNGTDALAGFSFYYASAYADTPTRKLGDLTLTALPTTAVSTLQGFNATATSLNQGISRDLGGFLFKGNNASVTEVYLPYTPTATTVTTNYLKAGEGNRVQTRQNNSHEFYWHPGDASFTMGFYESYNVLIPEYRSYLSIAKTLTSNAKRFNLIFEDGQTTGINTVNMLADDNSATLSDVWYTLQGTRLPVKPTAAGIYINGGRKVVIK